MLNSVSVVTHVHNQNKELKHLLRGLKKVNFSDELVVVAMGEEDPHELITDDLDFSVKLFYMERPSSELPLAQAKNIACSMAQGDTLIFLRPNQIPSQTILESIVGVLQLHSQSIILGKRKSLQKVPHKNWSFNFLDKICEDIPINSDQDAFIHGNFALTKNLYLEMKGFDERYNNHNTCIDFFLEAKSKGLSIIHSKEAIAYELKTKKQKADRIDLDALVHNCSVFFSKWGYFPEKSILNLLKHRGLIHFDERMGTVERIG
ncbi:MAG: hypothetical protein KC478_07685 [Bacteriovoracaceae bacterium]|nr:hypothetical protein [Bacteriovoracaceae bacterium]